MAICGKGRLIAHFARVPKRGANGIDHIALATKSKRPVYLSPDFVISRKNYVTDASLVLAHRYHQNVGVTEEDFEIWAPVAVGGR